MGKVSTGADQPAPAFSILAGKAGQDKSSQSCLGKYYQGSLGLIVMPWPAF